MMYVKFLIVLNNHRLIERYEELKEIKRQNKKRIEFLNLNKLNILFKN
jgi:hypothetical protein